MGVTGGAIRSLWSKAWPSAAVLVAVAAVVLAGELAAAERRAAWVVEPAGGPFRIAVVLSYSEEYEWQREVLEGIRSVTDERAELAVHEMRSLGVTDPSVLTRLGDEALAWVRAQAADAVIIADDHAMTYVYERGLRGGPTPVAFCGLNWPAAGYDFDAARLGGMVETFSADKAVALLRDVRPRLGRAVVLGSSRPIDRAEGDALVAALEAAGVTAEAVYVDRFEAWSAAFEEAQLGADALCLTNHAGIEGWDWAAAESLALERTATLTFTHHGWMRPLAAVALIKDGREQGVWAALEVMLAVERPAYPRRPVVLNREFRVSVNPPLLERAGIRSSAPLWSAGRPLR